LVEDQLEFIVEKSVFGNVVLVGRRIAQGWREDRIEANSQSILDHTGNYSLQNGTVQFQARIGVDLDQPRLEVRVNHEVESEYLKIAAFPVPIEEVVSRLNGIDSYLPHARVYFSHKVELTFLSVRLGQPIQISLQLRVVQLISWLKFSIVLAVLLDGIIGQMNQSVSYLLQFPCVA
jgi:hypothetical protein